MRVEGCTWTMPVTFPSHRCAMPPYVVVQVTCNHTPGCQHDIAFCCGWSVNVFLDHVRKCVESVDAWCRR